MGLCFIDIVVFCNMILNVYLYYGDNAELSAIVPCHRVVGSNGSLTGYAGGIDKKIQLLKLEGAYRKDFFVPKYSTAP